MHPNHQMNLQRKSLCGMVMCTLASGWEVEMGKGKAEKSSAAMRATLVKLGSGLLGGVATTYQIERNKVALTQRMAHRARKTLQATAVDLFLYSQVVANVFDKSAKVIHLKGLPDRVLSMTHFSTSCIIQ